MSSKLISVIKNKFINEFEKEPIVVFSPGRINIIGEHIDYNEGFVFPAAIDLGIAVAIQKSDEKQSRIFAYDKNELLYFNPLDPLKLLENRGWKNYILGILIELLKRDLTIPPFDLVFGGNIPGGAGLSSSAAIENGVVFAINELYNLGLSKEDMILISQRAEQNTVGVNCGIMDQYASMFGEKQHALLLDCRTLISKKVSIYLDNYELLLINSNVKHNLSEDSYNDRRKACENIAKTLNVTYLLQSNLQSLEKVKNIVSSEDYEKAVYVFEENERVLKAEKSLINNDFLFLGELLYQSHEGLKNQYKVSCDELDFLVDSTKNVSNVLGARMVGGGFGGCTLNIVKKGKSEEVIAQISEKFEHKFEKPCTPIKVQISQGTRTIN